MRKTVPPKKPRAERWARLERDTAAYFAGLPSKAYQEEAHLEHSLSSSIDEVIFIAKKALEAQNSLARRVTSRSV